MLDEKPAALPPRRYILAPLLDPEDCDQLRDVRADSELGRQLLWRARGKRMHAAKHHPGRLADVAVVIEFGGEVDVGLSERWTRLIQEEDDGGR